jgi:molecular chaperone GrpE
LVPVLDNLHLALESAMVSHGPPGFAEGVALTLSDCLQRMAPHGLKEIVSSPRDAFDPEIHEAVGVERAPGIAGGRVARMTACGYLLHDRLIRPVRVVLSKGDG